MYQIKKSCGYEIQVGKYAAIVVNANGQAVFNAKTVEACEQWLKNHGVHE